MADVKMQITVRPLSEWGDDELQRLYRLSVAHVRQVAELADDDPMRVGQLPLAQANAALYGEELVERGLL